MIFMGIVKEHADQCSNEDCACRKILKAENNEILKDEKLLT